MYRFKNKNSFNNIINSQLLLAPSVAYITEGEKEFRLNFFRLLTAEAIHRNDEPMKIIPQSYSRHTVLITRLR